MSRRQSLERVLVVWLVLYVLGGAANVAHASDFVLIVNESNRVSDLRTEDVSRIFLKKTRHWGNGVEIRPADRTEKSAVRRSFTKRVHGRSVSAIKMHWNKKIFTGRGVPPRELRSDAAVVEFVRKNPGAVGYVRVDAPMQRTRIVRLK